MLNMRIGYEKFPCFEQVLLIVDDDKFFRYIDCNSICSYQAASVVGDPDVNCEMQSVLEQLHTA